MQNKSKAKNPKDQLFYAYAEKILAIYDRPEKLLFFLNEASYNIQNYHPGFTWEGQKGPLNVDSSFFIKQMIRYLVIPWMQIGSNPKEIIKNFLADEDYDSFEKNTNAVSDNITTIMGAFSKQFYEEQLNGEDLEPFFQGISFLKCLFNFVVDLEALEEKKEEVANA